MRSAYIMLILLLAGAFCIVPAGADVSLDILQPSAHETVFAEMRDFYVYGTFVNTGEPADVRVRVYDSAGGLIRTLQSHVDSTGETSASSVDMSRIPEKTAVGRDSGSGRDHRTLWACKRCK
ncbi:MAG: hypothetical protein GX679_05315 [Methanocorpusculum parvum]|nr:hypothetical protein [Methanocorpusculum parvum]